MTESDAAFTAMIISLRQQRDDARARISVLEAALNDTEGALLGLRAAIDEHLPAVGSDGDYVAAVCRAGASLPDRRANVQGYAAGIPWPMHLRAWDVYAQRYGSSQSAERIHERGGFATTELDAFIPGWREENSEIQQLREENAALKKSSR